MKTAASVRTERCGCIGNGRRRKTVRLRPAEQTSADRQRKTRGTDDNTCMTAGRDATNARTMRIGQWPSTVCAGRRNCPRVGRTCTRTHARKRRAHNDRFRGFSAADTKVGGTMIQCRRRYRAETSLSHNFLICLVTIGGRRRSGKPSRRWTCARARERKPCCAYYLRHVCNAAISDDA